LCKYCLEGCSIDIKEKTEDWPILPAQAAGNCCPSGHCKYYGAPCSTKAKTKTFIRVLFPVLAGMVLILINNLIIIYNNITN
jgi:hypothetical protein